MQSRIDEIRSRGAKVLALAVDTPKRSSGVADQLTLSYRLICDPELEIVDAFGLRHRGSHIDGSDIARPVTLLIHRGRVAWRFVPDSWRIRLDVDDLLAAIDALPAGE